MIPFFFLNIFRKYNISLATCILVHISADYYRFSFLFFPRTVVCGLNRLSADLVVLGDLDSEQDQLSRAIESNICFYPVFLLT